MTAPDAYTSFQDIKIDAQHSWFFSKKPWPVGFKVFNAI
jgi:hypothetical protein